MTVRGATFTGTAMTALQLGGAVFATGMKPAYQAP